MITLTTKVHVEGLTGRQVTDFLLRAGDEPYQRWWPRTHLEYHAVRRVAGDVGSSYYFDEYVGERRIKMLGIVVEATPGKRLVWQMKRGIRLPAWLALELADDERGVAITHTIRAGFPGLGRCCDPLLRLYLSRRFRQCMDEHVRVEFKRLGELLGESDGAIGESRASPKYGF
jgi:hypothetical protein